MMRGQCILTAAEPAMRFDRCSVGLAREEQMREAMEKPVRPEAARPIDSTTAMAAAVAPTAR